MLNSVYIFTESYEAIDLTLKAFKHDTSIIPSYFDAYLRRIQQLKNLKAMSSRKQELSGQRSKKKREALKTFTHQPENLTEKKAVRIDKNTVVWINKSEDEKTFIRTYLENKALYEAANNTSRFGGKKKIKED